MIWEKYRKSNNYLQEHGYIDKAQWYWNMYLGNQWEGISLTEKKKADLPVMNITKQVVDYKTAAIGQNQMTAVFSDPKGGNDEVYDLLNDFWKKRWDKEDMNTKMYELVMQAGIQGDGFIYFGTNEKSQLIPDTSILLADENDPDIQSQKYIMIRQRLFVSDIKKQAMENGVTDISAITADTEDDYIVGNKNEIEYRGDEGKCTAVIYFEKRRNENGDVTVWTGKAVKGCDYEPLHPLSLSNKRNETFYESKLYPIVKLPCTTVPNNARGRGWVEDLTSNQLILNKTYARESASIATVAFPKIAYNTNALDNPEDLKEVGAPIAVNGNAESISSMIQYLNAQPMSGDVANFIEDVFTKTKMVAGASDAITGISDPTRVSGSAISEIREQSTLTLKGNVIKLKKCYEDIARIRLDTWQTYYPDGVEVQRTPTPAEQQEIENGEQVDLLETIDGATLRELEPNIVIDVSLQTEATKDGTQAILDNKLEKGNLQFSEWVEASDPNGRVPVAKLKKILEERKAKGLDINTGLPPVQQQM